MLFIIELWSEQAGCWIEWDVAASKGEALMLANHYRCPWQIVTEYGQVVG